MRIWGKKGGCLVENKSIEISPLHEEYFDGIIKLSNRIFGENYLNYSCLEEVLKKSIKNDHNSSFCLINYNLEKIIGFRLTYAPGLWINDYKLEIHPEEWGFNPANVAYMKSSCLDPGFLGQGLGRSMLTHAITETKKQNACAAVAHIWLHSPNNSAFKYFSRAGGTVIKRYPNYWSSIHNSQSPCKRCGSNCQCACAEMIINYSVYEEFLNV